MYECCSRSQCPEQAITNVTAVDTVSHVPRDLHYNLRMHSDTASVTDMCMSRFAQARHCKAIVRTFSVGRNECYRSPGPAYPTSRV